MGYFSNRIELLILFHQEFSKIIIDKYSVSGTYFFEGVSFIFLNKNNMQKTEESPLLQKILFQLNLINENPILLMKSALSNPISYLLAPNYSFYYSWNIKQNSEYNSKDIKQILKTFTQKKYKNNSIEKNTIRFYNLSNKKNFYLLDKRNPVLIQKKSLSFLDFIYKKENKIQEFKLFHKEIFFKEKKEVYPKDKKKKELRLEKKKNFKNYYQIAPKGESRFYKNQENHSFTITLPNLLYSFSNEFIREENTENYAVIKKQPEWKKEISILKLQKNNLIIKQINFTKNRLRWLQGQKNFYIKGLLNKTNLNKTNKIFSEFITENKQEIVFDSKIKQIKSEQHFKKEKELKEENKSDKNLFYTQLKGKNQEKKQVKLSILQNVLNELSQIYSKVILSLNQNKSVVNKNEAEEEKRKEFIQNTSNKIKKITDFNLNQWEEIVKRNKIEIELKSRFKESLLSFEKIKQENKEKTKEEIIKEKIIKEKIIRKQNIEKEIEQNIKKEINQNIEKEISKKQLFQSKQNKPTLLKKQEVNESIVESQKENRITQNQIILQNHEKIKQATFLKQIYLTKQIKFILNQKDTNIEENDYKKKIEKRRNQFEFLFLTQENKIHIKNEIHKRNQVYKSNEKNKNNKKNNIEIENKIDELNNIEIKNRTDKQNKIEIENKIDELNKIEIENRTNHNLIFIEKKNGKLIIPLKKITQSKFLMVNKREDRGKDNKIKIEMKMKKNLIFILTQNVENLLSNSLNKIESTTPIPFDGERKNIKKIDYIFNNNFYNLQKKITKTQANFYTIKNLFSAYPIKKLNHYFNFLKVLEQVGIPSISLMQLNKFISNKKSLYSFFKNSLFINNRLYKNDKNNTKINSYIEYKVEQKKHNENLFWLRMPNYLTVGYKNNSKQILDNSQITKRFLADTSYFTLINKYIKSEIHYFNVSYNLSDNIKHFNFLWDENLKAKFIDINSIKHLLFFYKKGIYIEEKLKRNPFIQTTIYKNIKEQNIKKRLSSIEEIKKNKYKEIKESEKLKKVKKIINREVIYFEQNYISAFLANNKQLANKIVEFYIRTKINNFIKQSQNLNEFFKFFIHQQLEKASYNIGNIKESKLNQKKLIREKVYKKKINRKKTIASLKIVEKFLNIQEKEELIRKRVESQLKNTSIQNQKNQNQINLLKKQLNNFTQTEVNSFIEQIIFYKIENQRNILQKNSLIKIINNLLQIQQHQIKEQKVKQFQLNLKRLNLKPLNLKQINLEQTNLVQVNLETINLEEILLDQLEIEQKKSFKIQKKNLWKSTRPVVNQVMFQQITIISQLKKVQIYNRIGRLWSQYKNNRIGQIENFSFKDIKRIKNHKIKKDSKQINQIETASYPKIIDNIYLLKYVKTIKIIDAIKIIRAINTTKIINRIKAINAVKLIRVIKTIHAIRAINVVKTTNAVRTIKTIKAIKVTETISAKATKKVIETVKIKKIAKIKKITKIKETAKMKETTKAVETTNAIKIIKAIENFNAIQNIALAEWINQKEVKNDKNYLKSYGIEKVIDLMLWKKLFESINFKEQWDIGRIKNRAFFFIQKKERYISEAKDIKKVIEQLQEAKGLKEFKIVQVKGLLQVLNRLQQIDFNKFKQLNLQTITIKTTALIQKIKSNIIQQQKYFIQESVRKEKIGELTLSKLWKEKEQQKLKIVIAQFNQQELSTEDKGILITKLYNKNYLIKELKFKRNHFLSTSLTLQNNSESYFPFSNFVPYSSLNYIKLKNVINSIKLQKIISSFSTFLIQKIKKDKNEIKEWNSLENWREKIEDNQKIENKNIVESKIQKTNKLQRNKEQKKSYKRQKDERRLNNWDNQYNNKNQYNKNRIDNKNQYIDNNQSNNNNQYNNSNQGINKNQNINKNQGNNNSQYDNKNQNINQNRNINKNQNKINKEKYNKEKYNKELYNNKNDYNTIQNNKIQDNKIQNDSKSEINNSWIENKKQNNENKLKNWRESKQFFNNRINKLIEFSKYINGCFYTDKIQLLNHFDKKIKTSFWDLKKDNAQKVNTSFIFHTELLKKTRKAEQTTQQFKYKKELIYAITKQGTINHKVEDIIQKNKDIIEIKTKAIHSEEEINHYKQQLFEIQKVVAQQKLKISMLEERIQKNTTQATDIKKFTDDVMNVMQRELRLEKIRHGFL